MVKCPNCEKELTIDDYEIFFTEEEDTSYYIVCSSCGYDERDVWNAE